jgi:hypothetical protein
MRFGAKMLLQIAFCVAADFFRALLYREKDL